ncbi:MULTISPECIES: hypothetical protein [unclassified Sporosarcina]|uniref:YqgU-like beta propeller domain-containing protein n=1 Tax=unclassified Sporosarcina TaxID=2647733 RepID=UPI00203C6B2B|nr:MULTISPECIES: hypothetical protein [unclassified Sporosarcina]GKV64606.1 hypothetical protein NCCP2331_07590 [Sporosarcina sp. NCCP-2331]GLB54521.1 hypothetical protein NCCP2378_03060 [Sporosarcina sp. NCCP-2378]
MKRTILMISLSLFLVGCEQTETERHVEPDNPGIVKEVFTPKILPRAEGEIRFVAGWWDEEQILYIDHQEGLDRLRSFNIATGSVHTMFTDQAAISEVLIHPSKEQVLIKTANHATEANIAILDKDMTILDEVTVESSELELQWNAVDSNQLLISAFQEDWSFQVMHYDINERKIQPIEVDNPFPKWLGKDQIVYLDDSELIKETFEKKEKEVLAADTVELHNSAGQLLVESAGEDHKEYAVLDSDGEEKYSWQAETSSETIEDVEFIDEDNIIMSTREEISDDDQSALFIHRQEGQEVKRYETAVEGGMIDCSPDGNSCLVGYSLDTILQLDTGETMKWTE